MWLLWGVVVGQVMGIVWVARWAALVSRRFHPPLSRCSVAVIRVSVVVVVSVVCSRAGVRTGWGLISRKVVCPSCMAVWVASQNRTGLRRLVYQ